MTTSGVPDDLNDFSYIHAFHPSLDADPRSYSQSSSPAPFREPSPNSAALLGPADRLAPAPVSRTKDGRIRVMDLNQLGLSRGVPQIQIALHRNTCNSAGQSEWPHDFPRQDRVSIHQSASTIPPQAVSWRQEQRQRADDARARVHQAYVSELRSDASFAPTEQEMLGSSSRRSMSGIHDVTVTQDQMRMRNQMRQRLDEAQRQRERQRVRQELFRPMDQQQVIPEYPATSAQMVQIPRDHGMGTPYYHVELTEAELDEKRRQLLIKKAKETRESSAGRAKKNKKCRNGLFESAVQESGQISPLVPHKPRASTTHKENSEESFSKINRMLIGKVKSSVAEDHVVNTDDEIGSGYAPSIPHDGNQNKRYAQVYCPSNYGPGSQGYGPEKDDRSAGTSTGGAIGYVPSEDRATDLCPHPPLIPRQTSQQTMCWNSDTAKRGLGFRSKQRKESWVKGAHTGSGESHNNNAITELKRAMF